MVIKSKTCVQRDKLRYYNNNGIIIMKIIIIVNTKELTLIIRTNNTLYIQHS